MSYSREHTLTHVILRLERGWLPELSENPTRGGQFHDATPYPLSLFLDAEVKARAQLRPSLWRFLEVGSSLGVKLLTMYYRGWDVSGIEHIREYAETSKRMCPAADIYEVEAEEFDYWHNFDYIFMYRPIHDEKRMQNLVNKIASSVTTHTVLFFPLCPAPTVDHIKRLDDDLYVVID